MILQSLAGLPAFLVYFCTGLIAIVAYLLVYTRITPHNEFQLIRDNEPAAAIALGLSLLGFVAPLVSAIVAQIRQSSTLAECAIALISGATKPSRLRPSAIAAAGSLSRISWNSLCGVTRV